MRAYDWKWKHTAAVVMFCGMAMACFGCSFNAAGYYKTVSTGAVASSAGYLALKQVDDAKTASIVSSAHQHPEQAKTDKAAWTAIFDKALKGLDVFHDTVIGALREGPPIQGLIVDARSYQKWIAALTVASASLGLALSDAGINWQALLTANGGK